MPANHVCMWEDKNYGGDKWVDRAAPKKGKSVFVDIHGWNGDNEISSINNNTNCDVDVYADDKDHRKGKNYLVDWFNPKTKDGNLTNNDFWFTEYDYPGEVRGHTTDDSVNDDIESFVIECK